MAEIYGVQLYKNKRALLKRIFTRNRINGYGLQSVVVQQAAIKVCLLKRT
jgi:hypothetical protein